ncbi:MAG: PadR family transcriptional regulator [Gemmatimonadetes bacterium]|nr:PadR family transcriptional regulator [Gemmatimonadota bacterium]MBI3569159.1 PadR family transcriptional regulator [Gemmatimonadota bacterium]
MRHRDCRAFGGDGPRWRMWAGRGFDWRGEQNFGAFFFGGGRGRGGPWRAGRMFEQGDLKFVILQLLAEKPRHGYDVIKALEERSGGRYAPSPGTVYPTLTLLEEMGFAVATAEEGGKRVYAITDEGRAYLEANRSTVDEVLDRLSELGASIFGDAVRPAHEAMGALGREYARLIWRRSPDSELATKVAEVLQRAARELADLGAKP